MFLKYCDYRDVSADGERGDDKWFDDCHPVDTQSRRKETMQTDHRFGHIDARVTIRAGLLRLPPWQPGRPTALRIVQYWCLPQVLRDRTYHISHHVWDEPPLVIGSNILVTCSLVKYRCSSLVHRPMKRTKDNSHPLERDGRTSLSIISRMKDVKNIIY
jgi:hypothetical protein